MRKSLMVLCLLVSLVALMTTVAHAEGRPMLSSITFGPR